MQKNINPRNNVEEKLSTNIQKNTSKCSKEQDRLTLDQKLNTTTEHFSRSDQQLVNMKTKSTLDVAKSSTRTEPASVGKCTQSEKVDPGLVLQQDNRKLVQSAAKRHFKGVVDALELCREVSRESIRRKKLELQNNSESDSHKAKLTNWPSVVCQTSPISTNSLNGNEKEIEEEENDTNVPTGGMRCSLLAKLLEESSSSEPESSYTDSFETPDSSFEDLEHKNASGIKTAGAAQNKYVSELIHEMSDDLSLFTDQKDTYKMMFNKQEIRTNKRTQNELCPGLFHLRFGKTTANISNVILSKSPGESKFIDAMYDGHLKFPTKLHRTSRQSERLAFLETEEGNYDVAMCETYPQDREMKQKLNKVSGFVSQTYQMSFSRGEARRYPVIRNTDICATPKYKFSEMGKKVIQNIKYVRVNSEGLPTKAEATDKLEDKARVKSEGRAFEVTGKKTVRDICGNKSPKERNGSVERDTDMKKEIGNKQMASATNKQLCKYNIELDASSSVPCGPHKATVRPFVTKQGKESKCCVDLDQTDDRKSGTNKQQENAISKLREQGTRPNEQRATEPGQKASPKNHESGSKISSSAYKNSVQIQKGYSGTSGRTSNNVTLKTTLQINSEDATTLELKTRRRRPGLDLTGSFPSCTLHICKFH